jgi:ubiquinone biosynthesis protein UbiJ
MLLEQIASVLNRNVSASSRAQSLCERLEGRSLGVHIEGLRLDVVAHVDAGRIALAGHAEREPDARVSGTPLTLLSMVGPGSRGRLRSGAVTITGDAEVAQGFQDLLRAAQPDFEEELSRLVGDVTAHQIGNFVRAASGWGRKAAETLAANVSEYLQEESRDLVTSTELEEFLAGVDELRESADRLQARVELLLKSPSPQPSPQDGERGTSGVASAQGVADKGPA